MTTHYNQDIHSITAQNVIDGWNYHGKGLPPAYAITSAGDRVAMFCWDYLEQIKEKKAKPIEEYCDFGKERKDLQEKTKKLLTEVVELSGLKK